MADTDRTIAKKLFAGTMVPAVTDAPTLASDRDSDTRDITKTGSENAATNVAETFTTTVFRKVRPRAISILTGTNIASDNTNYVVISFFKRENSGAGAQTLLGSWNTHGAAQKGITLGVPAVIDKTTGFVDNSDMVISASHSAPAVISYSIGKLGSGQSVAQYTTFSIDFEEI